MVVMGVLLCMPNIAHSTPSLRVNGLEISSSKLAPRHKTANMSQELVNPAHKSNVSNTASRTSFAGIISEDSYAFSHKEDLGFSIFLDRRSVSFVKETSFESGCIAQQNFMPRHYPGFILRCMQMQARVVHPPRRGRAQRGRKGTRARIARASASTNRA